MTTKNLTISFLIAFLLSVPHLVRAQTPTTSRSSKVKTGPAPTPPPALDRKAPSEEVVTDLKELKEPETPSPVSEKPPVRLGRSNEEIARERQAEDLFDSHRTTIGYGGSLLGIAIPFKHGPLISYRSSRKWAFEASYFGGSIALDTPIIKIGSISESLIYVDARRFAGQSTFNWIIGLGRHAYDAKLGEDLIVSGAIPTSFALMKIRTLDLHLGFGNRWVLENGFTFGADWVVLNVPIYTLESDVPALNYVNNASTRSQIEDAVAILRRIPTFAIGKLYVAYSF